MMDKYKTYAQYFILAFCLFFGINTVLGQEASDYTYTASLDGSFDDMSSSTQLVGPNSNDVASSVTDIGFDIWFMGQRYTQFSVNSGGVLRLGGTIISGLANSIGGVPNQARISPYTVPSSSEINVSSTGKVHYISVGTAPNRRLIIEWNDMWILGDADISPTTVSGSNRGTYRAVLYETDPNSDSDDGQIQFVYDEMVTPDFTGCVSGSGISINVGFQTSTGTIGTDDLALIDVDDNTVIYTTTGTVAIVDTYITDPDDNCMGDAGDTGIEIPTINTTTDGSRRVYQFNPEAPNGIASNVSTSCLTTTTISLIWDENATNEVGSVIYRSEDGTNYSFLAQTAAGTTNYDDTGLTAGDTYYYRIYTVSEGKLSSLGATASLTVTTAGGGGTVAYAVQNGNWNTGSTWSTNTAPTTTTDVVISCDYTVTVTASDAACSSLTVASGSTLEFNNNGDLDINGDFSNAGTFDMSGNTITTNLAGNLTNTGTWSPGDDATFTFDGTTAQTVSNTGSSSYTAIVPSTTTTYPYTADPVSANAQTGFSGGTTFYFNRITINVPDAGTISDINYSMDVTHSDINDLAFSLEGPDGNFRFIGDMTSGGCANLEDNMDFTLDDESANGDIEDQCSGGNPSISGTYQPSGGTSQMNDFDGESMSGDWTLSVYDFYDQETGTSINNASLTITYGGSSSAVTTNDLAFYNMVVNNATGVTFTDDDARILNNLSLTSGITAMGANEMVFADDATSDVGGNTNHVTGTIRKIGNDVFDFPIGNGTYIANLSISAPTDETEEFTVTYTRSDPDPTWDTDTKEATINNVSRVEYWIVEHPVGSSSVHLSVSYENTRSGGVGMATDLTIAHWSGGLWIDEGRNNSLAPANYTGLTSSTAISSFSPITLASTNAAGLNPLPVTLINFNATKKEEGVILQWQTASEINSDYFTIERSLDGKIFQEIGTKEAQGNTTQRIDYNFWDYESVLKGQVYYRLKMVDQDATFEYTEVKSVSFGDQEFALSKVGPNPFHNQINIIYELPKEGEVIIQLIDLLGRTMLQKEMKGQQGINEWTVEQLDKIPSGTYILRASYGNKVITKKMLK